jgi:HK97 family phage major capsid protein
MRRTYCWPTIARPKNALFFALISAKAIREQMCELSEQAKAIEVLAASESRELNDKEKAEQDGIIAKYDAMKADLARAEKLEKIMGDMAATRAAEQTPEGDPEPPPEEKPLSARVRIPDQARFRSSRLHAFRGERAEERAYIAGQFYAATLFKNERAAEWCKDHGIDTRFNASLSEGTDSAGGFLVPGEVEQTIIDLREEYGVFRQNANVVPMARDTKTVPVRSSGLTAYFVGENAEITASDKAWKQVELTARKLAALVRYSNELNEDATISIGDDLTREIAYAFAVKEDACGFLGDGTSTYGHITGVINSVAAGSIYTAITGNTAFSTLDLTDFEAMVGKLPAYPGIQPKWFISKAGWAASMLRLTDAGGGNTAAMLQAGSNGMMFLGYPVVHCQTLNSTLTAQTSAAGVLLFGDLRMAAILGNRRGLAIALSTDRYFEYDQLGIRGVERFDINVHSRGDASNPGAILSMSLPGS